MRDRRATTARPQILIAGGGYVGLYAARALEQRLEREEADVVLVNPENFMVYRPLLPEVAAGTLEPRHAVVPLRDALKRTRFLSGSLTGLDHGAGVATVATHGGSEQRIGYDHVVLALGGMTRVLPVPGLAEHGLGFTSVAEATGLRDHMLDRLEVAAAATTDRQRRRALTFVFVGGGYTGLEALAELHDMASHVIEGYATLARHDLRFVLVEVTGRLLPTISEDLAADAYAELTRRGVDVRLETRLESADADGVQLSDGERIDADTLVWVAGVTPHHLGAQLGLPVDDRGRIEVDASLRVRDTPGVWAAGDCALVPDLVAGGSCPPTAQYAVREGRQLGRNLAAVVRGAEPTEFRYSSRGQFVTLGMRKAVAEVFGRRLTGFPAWAIRRGYYGSQIPTPNRKVRVFLDWAVRMPFGHDVANLGSVREPRAAFQEAAGSRDDVPAR